MASTPSATGADENLPDAYVIMMHGDGEGIAMSLEHRRSLGRMTALGPGSRRWPRSSPSLAWAWPSATGGYCALLATSPPRPGSRVRLLACDQPSHSVPIAAASVDKTFSEIPAIGSGSALLVRDREGTGTCGMG